MSRRIMRTPPKNGTQCLGRKIILQPILHCVFIMVETTMVRSCLPHSSEIIFANISIFRTLYTVSTNSTAINWVKLKLMELTLNTNQRVNQHSSNLSLCPFVHRSEEWKLFFLLVGIIRARTQIGTEVRKKCTLKIKLTIYVVVVRYIQKHSCSSPFAINKQQTIFDPILQ